MQEILTKSYSKIKMMKRKLKILGEKQKKYLKTKARTIDH